MDLHEARLGAYVIISITVLSILFFHIAALSTHPVVGIMQCHSLSQPLAMVGNTSGNCMGLQRGTIAIATWPIASTQLVCSFMNR